MKQDTDTWYVLADGTHAEPSDVETGKDGVLRHKNGVPVALREDGVPLTSGVATKTNKRAAEAGPAKKAVETSTSKQEAVVEQSKEVKADKPKPSYKTRESKAK